MKEDLNDRMNIGYYAVCFIDLLGQQDRLRALSGLPDEADEAQMAGFVQALKGTYGVVTGTRKLFATFFKSYSAERRTDLSALTEEQRHQYAKMKSNQIHTALFSDSMVAFTSLADQDSKLPVSGLFGVIGAAASTMLSSLAAGHPVRGAVDIGLGMEIEEGEIYGPCLSRAYTLESRTAQYPRILVGQECINYLNQTARQEPKDIYAQASIAIAQTCIDLLAVDNDGYAIVDYLGKGFKSSIAHTLDRQVVKNAFGNVIKFSEACRDAKDTRLAFRYALLRNYFQHRLKEWGIDEKGK